jgi:ATPase subunit of ABC transporter with duplicated ATPase domains
MAADPSKPFIYVMKELRKVVPPKREILKGIWLSFYYGAKIGVLGANGAGKSSLVKIMAGADPEFIGEAGLGKGYTVGFLEQEPKLDPRKSVLENVQDGVGDRMKVVRRWNEISARFAEPMSDAEMEKLLAEQAKVQDQMDAQNLWDLDRHLEIAMDALRSATPR